jgi:hypothetical protein
MTGTPKKGETNGITYPIQTRALTNNIPSHQDPETAFLGCHFNVQKTQSVFCLEMNGF